MDPLEAKRLDKLFDQMEIEHKKRIKTEHNTKGSFGNISRPTVITK